MTPPQSNNPPRHGERLGRTRGERSTSSTSRLRRTGMVSEAVVSRYIRDLAEHGRRVHGVAVRPQAATR